MGGYDSSLSGYRKPGARAPTTLRVFLCALATFNDRDVYKRQQSALVIIGFFAVLVMADRTSVGDGAFAGQPSDRPDSAAEELSERKGYQRSEIFPLTLFSLGGMMIFPAADNFVTLDVYKRQGQRRKAYLISDRRSNPGA